MYDRSRTSTRRRWWLVIPLLAIVAILLLNTSQLSPLRDVVNRVTLPAQRVLRQMGDSLRGLTGGVGDLTTLRARNRELEEQVASLTVENLRLHEVEAENARLRSLLNFASSSSGYGYKGSQIIGRVVAAEPSNIVESILIDLGSKQGMMVGMPVVTERGLVGRITEVYQSASRVLLITDSNSSVNTLLQNARLRGVLRGRTEQDPIMDYLPPEEQVSIGDIVLTSGEGGAFPNGIPVGQVVEVERNDVEMFQRAIVRTTVDFNTLETVLVVTSFVPVQNLQRLPER